MESAGALGRMRIVEYGELVSAPFCSRLLADAGADVIKVERPGVGDRSRRHGPFLGDVPHPEHSGLFLVLNNNKLGVTLDLEQATGRGILLSLLDTSDVFVENTPYGFLQRLGLDYATLHQRFPRLIYVSLSPYGRTGPYRNYRGYDANSASLGGVAEQIGRAPRAPLPPPFDQGGHQAGLAAASACLVAVLARLRDGWGQHVDIAEADVWATTQTGVEYLVYEVDGVQSMRERARAQRSADSFPPPYWRTRDGIIVGGGAQAAQFERFLEAIGRPEWVADPRFADRRNLSFEAAHELLEVAKQWFASRTTAEALRAMFRYKLPFTPVLTIGELVNGPHERARGFFQEIARNGVGMLTYPVASFMMSRSPMALRRPAPLLGEHNEAVYRGRLGYSQRELVELFQAGII